MSQRQLRFLLNGRRVTVDPVDPNQTVLQYLRSSARLTGTKEGCAEGDCGACMVVIAQADENNELQWCSVNSCIRLLSTVDRTALFTVDGLRDSSAQALHPVQQAMADAHASQCGFCTPGFVMSLYAMYQQRGLESLCREQIEDVLSGNLCRCTGYRPIIDAALRLRDVRGPDPDNALTIARELTALSKPSGTGEKQQNAVGNAFRPQSVDELLSVRSRYPGAQLIAGCTDVGLWVTKQHQRFDRTIDVTSVSELHTISQSAQRIRIGAAARLQPAWNALVAKWPSLKTYAVRFASLPIRNSGTLGGNIANGSPIGDSMPLLLALGASVVVGSVRGERSIPLSEFYSGRQQTAMTADEVLLWIDVPVSDAPAFVAAYKVSKRFDQDISAVCIGVHLVFESPPDDRAGAQVVALAQIGVGGMAATPLRATQTEQVLHGALWEPATVERACAAIATEFSPISDMRASGQYRSDVICGLIRRAWHESQGTPVTVESL